MPEYFYRARTRLGDVTKGTTKAVSAERATQMLSEHGLAPLEVRDVRELGFWRREIAFGGVSKRHRAIFARQLATMIEAGIPILQGIRILVQQLESPKLSSILREVGYEVEGGTPLSQALEKYPRAFSEFFVSMVRSGETSGRVAAALHVLADHEERDADVLRKVRAALIYPAVILGAMLVLMVLMMTVVLPPLVALFEEVNVQLPFTTRVVIVVVRFLQGYWWFVLAFLALAVYLVLRYVRSAEGRYNASAFLLRVPVIGRLLRKLFLARVSGALETLLEAEVPIVRALIIARDVLTNRVYRAIFDQTAEDVKNGGSISESLERYPEVPLMVSEMVNVGERSGRLGPAFGSIHRFFRRDVEDALSNLTTLLEPLVIILVGIGVAFLLLAVLLPIYGLVQVIQ